MKKNLFRPISLEEFKQIKEGDMIRCQICGEIYFEEAACAAFYNYDADEPDWEIETVDGVCYCWDSIVVPKDNYEELQRRSIYDELCSVLTDWEEMKASSEDLYNMLVKIQNNWETVITASED